MSFGGGSGSSSISGSTDVVLSNPTNSQVLGYNSGLAKWENQTVSGGSGGIITVGLTGSGATYIANNVTGADIAINQALTAVGAGGAVWLLAGTFNVKAPITLATKQTLAGCGPLSSMLNVVSGFSGGAVIQTPAGYNGVRNVVHDLGIEGNNLVGIGVNLVIDNTPSSYGPDPNPWINRVFVSNVTGDGFYLGGAYSGGQREAKVTDCRVEHAGGWGYNVQSSDMFLGGNSAQGCSTGGFWLNAGNIKAWGCKAYSMGASTASPAPGFRLSARGIITGCEAQDNIGNGFEVISQDVNLSGCVADSNGDGITDNISAGFYINASYCHIDGSSYQRPGGGATWKVAGAGQMYSLRLASGADHIYAMLSTGSHSSPYSANLSGVVGGASNVTFV
jgi:hypothetical protein